MRTWRYRHLEIFGEIGSLSSLREAFNGLSVSNCKGQGGQGARTCWAKPRPAIEATISRCPCREEGRGCDQVHRASHPPRAPGGRTDSHDLKVFSRPFGHFSEAAQARIISKPIEKLCQTALFSSARLLGGFFRFTSYHSAKILTLRPAPCGLEAPVRAPFLSNLLEPSGNGLASGRGMCDELPNTLAALSQQL